MSAVIVLGLGFSAPAFASSQRAASASVAAHNPAGKFLGVVPSRAGALRASARPFVTMPMTYHGGPVQHSSAVYAIFWVPPSYSLPAGYETLISRYFTDVAHDSFKPSNVYASDTQYYDRTGGTKRFASYATSFRGAIVDTGALPADGCPNYVLEDGSMSADCITDAQIEDEINSVVAAHHFPKGLSSEYFLFTPIGLGTCFDATALASGGCFDPSGFAGYCGYHSFTDMTASAVLYANLGVYEDHTGCSTGASPNGNAADGVLDGVSHEHNETITDPLGTAWFDSSDAENGDKCNFRFGAPAGTTTFGPFNQVINGNRYWLQQEWSNRTNSCVQRNKFPQPTASFKFSPTHPAHGTPVHFTATAHDSDDTTLTYRWTFAVGATSSLAHPVHTFGFGGIKHVTLVVTDPHGDQTRVARAITVT